MNPKHNFYIAPAQNEDWEEINDLYFFVTGKKRSKAQYQWEWVAPPNGPGSRWVIREKNTDKIVGHHGLIPVPFFVSGQSWLAGKTENTMVHPDYRKKMYYPSYERMLLPEAQKRFQVLYTTAGKGIPGAIRRRMGYEHVGDWRLYLLNISQRYQEALFLHNPGSHRLKKSLPPNILALFFRFYSGLRKALRYFTHPVVVNRIDNIDEYIIGLASFWQQNHHCFGITADRNKDYLAWRIKQNPYRVYQTFAFRDQEGICGYALIREEKETRSHLTFVKHSIEDFLVKDNAAPLYHQCLNALMGKLSASDLLTCKTLDIDDAFNKALKKCQFYPLRSLIKKDRPSKSPFLACYNGAISDKKWFVTELLTEGVA